MAVTFEQIRTIALRLPEVEEGPWYGKPAFKVAGKGFMRLFEDGSSLVLRMSLIDRSLLLETEPETFYITEHFRNFPAVLVRLAKLNRAGASDLVANSWRLMAPARLLRASAVKAPAAKRSASTRRR